MSLSAASLLAVFAFSNAPQSLGGDEKNVFAKIAPSVVMIVGGGPAALIDQRGWFLAHKDGLPQLQAFLARDGSGRVLTLKPLSEDDVTQLVLLEAIQGWVPGQASPIRVADPGMASVKNAKPEASVRLIAIGPNGPFRAEISEGNRIGITGPARRGVTLNELRYESISPLISGSLLFTPNGELVGVFTATLESVNQAQSFASKAVADTQNIARGGIPNSVNGGPGALLAPAPYGPQSMSVSYSVTPDILARVVNGFLSAGHRVLHPTLGLLCREMPEGGAQIFSVSPNSGAQLAGLKPGDVITHIAGGSIRTVGDFTRAVLKLKVGTQVEVRIQRGTEAKAVPVRVGS